MDSVDQLLAQLKAEQEPPRSPAAVSPSKANDRSAVPPAQSLDNLLHQLTDDTQRSVRKTLSQSPSAFHSTRAAADVPAHHQLLSDLKTHYVNQDQAEVAKQQEELQAAEQQRQQQAQEQQRQQQAKQRRLEQLQAKRRAELIEPATEWLQRLNPRSEEGRWFEEFACGYDSRLEAAIDYLEALQSVGDESIGKA